MPPVRNVGKIDEVISKGDVLSGHRSLEKAQEYRYDFCKTFGLLDNDKPLAEPPELVRQIDFYIVDVVLGIAYYTTHIGRARKERNGYVALVLILIITIPILLALLSTKSLGFPGNVVVAQIVGGLTAIAGLQKVLSALAAAGQRYAIWRSTSATLKTLWYGLLTKWPPSTTPGSFDQAKFLSDLAAGQLAARAAIDAEQDDYFKTLALPAIDILGTLTAATATANSLVTGLVPTSSVIMSSSAAATKSAAEALQARADIEKNTAIIEALKGLMAEKTTALIGADPATATALQASITSFRASMTTAETALVSARAALAVAQPSVV